MTNNSAHMLYTRGMIHNIARPCIFFLVGVLALMLSACTARTTPTVASASVVEALSFGKSDAYARPTAPMNFVFPRDHGPHTEYRTEWWYYTGNLTGNDGAEFGYQLTFFRSALAPDMPARDSDLATNQMYMAHFALTDAAAQRHASFERFNRGAAGLAGATGEPAFAVWLDEWSAREVEPGVMRVQASAEGDDGLIAIDLTMRETQPKLLHGDRGLSAKGSEAGNANYYYSLVQMATEGTVVSSGTEYVVTGKSWMDHEFGTSALSNNTTGWDWFAVQLDDGTSLMFGEFHDAEGGNRFVYEGTLAFADGSQYALGQGDFLLETQADWTSPTSGIIYPAAWRVIIPEHNIELSIEPIVADQEMDVSFVYYEGATRITGSMRGAPVSGRGYVELTGYGAVATNTRAGD